MWEVQIGEIIRNQREKYGIRQGKLAEGICTASSLSKIENGVVLPTRYKLVYLLERLGEDSEQFIVLCSKREKEFNDRLRIFNSCVKSDPGIASYMLRQVQNVTNASDSMECQILGECRLRVEIEEKNKSFEMLEKEAMALLQKTKPFFSFAKMRNELLSKTEWNIIIDYSRILSLQKKKEEALYVLIGLRAFFLKNNKDQDLIRGDYEIVLLRMVEILIHLGRFAEADAFNDELVEGILNQQEVNNLTEVMIGRTVIAINLNKPPEYINKMINQTRILIQMEKGKETVERFDNYLKKECGYTWENTA